MGSYQDKPLMINEDHLEKYGFACFYQGKYPELNHGYWQRAIEIAIDGGGRQRYKKLKIPESLLIKLEPNAKLCKHKNFKISRNAQAMAIVKLLSERAGWNQTTSDLELMNTKSESGVFIANFQVAGQDISLGSGAVFPVNDNLAWIGMILVHPELRRQGIARQVMTKCLSHIRLHHKQTIIGLDATPLGKQVYEALGFKDSFTIWRSTIDTNTPKVTPSNWQFSPLDLPGVRDYLKTKNYPERRQLIGLLATIPDSYNLVISGDGKTSGFVMSRPGRLKPFVGPLIADNDETTSYLLKEVLNYWKEKGFHEVFMDIPEYHIDAKNLFADSRSGQNASGRITITPVRSFSRMYQLISDVQADNLQINDEAVLQKSLSAYDQTMSFAEKEKYEIAPIMYGTSGPEWS